MKALVVNHAGVLGGATVSMLDVLQAMDELNIQVELACTSRPETAQQMLRQKGYTVSSVPFVMSAGGYNGGVTLRQPLSWLVNKLHVARSKKRLAAIIKNSDCDLVIANSMSLYYVGALAKRYGKKAVCFQRETITEGIVGHRIRRKMAKNFEAIVCISEYDRAGFAKYETVKTFVICDKIDINRFAQLAAPPNKNRVLFLGGFSELKGTMTALKACAGMPEMELYLAGSCNGRIIGMKDCKGLAAKLRFALYGNYENTCRRYIEKHGLGPRIHQMPPNEGVHKLYEACDAVLFCPTKPHQSRLIYESAAAGRPIVIPDSPQTKEFAYSHVLTYRSGDVDSCIAQLRQAVASAPQPAVEDAVVEKHSHRTLQAELQQMLEEVSKL